MLQYSCAVNISFVRTVFQNGQFVAFCFSFCFSINDVLVVAFLMWIGLSKEFVNSVLFYSWL